MHAVPEVLVSVSGALVLAGMHAVPEVLVSVS